MARQWPVDDARRTNVRIRVHPRTHETKPPAEEQTSRPVHLQVTTKPQLSKRFFTIGTTPRPKTALPSWAQTGKFQTDGNSVRLEPLRFDGQSLVRRSGPSGRSAPSGGCGPSGRSVKVESQALRRAHTSHLLRDCQAPRDECVAASRCSRRWQGAQDGDAAAPERAGSPPSAVGAADARTCKSSLAALHGGGVRRGSRVK